MNIDDITRKQPLRHVGYVPANISISRFTIPELAWFQRLKTKPRKITAYFYANKIKSVYKLTHVQDRLNDYYLIRSTDDTIFMVNYYRLTK